MKKHLQKVKEIMVNFRVGVPKHWLRLGLSVRVAGFKTHRWWPKDWREWLRLGVIMVIIIYFVSGGVVLFFLRREKNNFCQPLAIAKIYPLPVVVVNGSAVWRDNFCRLVEQNDYFYQVTKQTPPGREALYQEVDDLLIEDKLLTAAGRQYHQSVGVKDVDETINKMAEENGGLDVLEKMLDSTYQTSLRQFRKLVRIQLQRERVQDNLIEQVKARHILIRDENRAKEILAKVSAGEDFNNLAKQFSEDVNSREKGGDLGWFSRGQMVREFEEAAFTKAPIGKVYDALVKTEYGWHIIIVDEKKGQINKSFVDFLRERKEKVWIWVWLR